MTGAKSKLVGLGVGLAMTLGALAPLAAVAQETIKAVLAEGSLDQVSQNPQVIERYLGR